MEHPTPKDQHPFEPSLQDNLASEISRWAFFVCGIILVVAAAILPLRADLDWTRHQRDLALVAEQQSIARNQSYAQMIHAIEQKNPDTLALLVQSNLGKIPSDHHALLTPGESADPMLFELLEPAPIDPPEYSPRYSRLERMVLVPRARLWVIAGGILLVLIGILRAAVPE